MKNWWMSPSHVLKSRGSFPEWIILVCVSSRFSTHLRQPTFGPMRIGLPARNRLVRVEGPDRITERGLRSRGPQIVHQFKVRKNCSTNTILVKEPDLKCPFCGSLNPDGAQQCDCGYDFECGKMKIPRSKQTKPVVSQKSEIRNLGLKNLAVCVGWFVAAALLFLTRAWFGISKFLEGLAQSFSGGSKGVGELLGAVASIFAMTILIGWILLLPSALIMTIMGYYPRLLRAYTFFKPEEGRAANPKRPQPNSAAERMLGQASDLEYRGDWDAALTLYRRVASMEGNSHAESATKCIAELEKKRERALGGKG